MASGGGVDFESRLVQTRDGSTTAAGAVGHRDRAALEPGGIEPAGGCSNRGERIGPVPMSTTVKLRTEAVPERVLRQVWTGKLDEDRLLGGASSIVGTRGAQSRGETAPLAVAGGNGNRLLFGPCGAPATADRAHDRRVDTVRASVHGRRPSRGPAAQNGARHAHQSRGRRRPRPQQHRVVEAPRTVPAQSPAPSTAMPRDTRPPVAAPSTRRHRLRVAAATGTVNPPAVTSVDVDALPDVLLLADVARLLRCSTSTVNRRLMDGTFPVAPLLPISHSLRWSRDRLLDWINGDPSRRRPPLGRARPAQRKTRF